MFPMHCPTKSRAGRMFTKMGQDFWYRWSGERYVIAGTDPFRVAFWSSEHSGSVPPDLPAELRAKAGDPPGRRFAAPTEMDENGGSVDGFGTLKVAPQRF